MKKSKELIGLSLICIQEGIEFGKTIDLILDPEQGKAEFLVIDDGHPYREVKLLPLNKITGIGTSAITTDTEANIQSFSTVQAAVDLAEKNVKIVGAKVYTKNGQYIGIIDEYQISEEDGKIIKCHLNEPEEGIILSKHIITYGQDVIVVSDEALKENLSPSVKIKEPAGTDAPSSASEKPPLPAESPIPAQSPVPAEPLESSPSPKTKIQNTAKIFEERQKQFLMGRKATKRIVTEKGEILIDEGEAVTSDIFDKIRENGKLIELTMNTQP